MDAMWNIAKDVGWGFLYQIGGVVSYVQDSAASFVDQNTVGGKSQSQSQRSMEDDGQKMKDGGDEKYNETELDNAQNDEMLDSSENSDEIITDSNENDNDEYDNDDKISSPQNNDNIETSQSSSSVSIQRSQPIHSVLESYSSLSSLEADLASIEKEKYIHDFIDMLKKGLYVFAWCNDCSIIKHSSGNGPDSMNSNNQDEISSKKYQLRVLKMVETSNQSANGEITQSFVLNPVESRLEEEGIDIISFPVLDISRVKASRRGIQFMTEGAKFSTDILPPATTMSLSESTTTVTSIVSSEADAQEEAVIREELVAEVVLSDDQDKDILLFGLNIFLSRICEK